MKMIKVLNILTWLWIIVGYYFLIIVNFPVEYMTVTYTLLVIILMLLSYYFKKQKNKKNDNRV